MILNLGTWGIVLAGHWNRMIFTPDWVGEKLFHEDEVEAEFALLPGFPVLYRHSQVLMEAVSSRLVFRPRFNTEEALKMSERMALAALTELPNTPLLGVGINFSFKEANPTNDLLKLFNVGDAGAIARRGWETPETTVVRKLTGKDGSLNLTLFHDGSSIAIDLNFDTISRGRRPPRTRRRARRSKVA